MSRGELWEGSDAANLESAIKEAAERLAVGMVKSQQVVMNAQPTLRDQFAMAALAGWIARGQSPTHQDDPDTLADFSYQMADAMLRARQNEGGGEG